MEISLIVTNPNLEENLTVRSDSSENNYSLNSDNPLITDITISASDTAALGEYKILLGAKTSQVSFSKYLTILVE